MKTTIALLGLLLFAATLFAQTAPAPAFPKFEASVGYSLANVHPDSSAVDSFNVNGGTAAVVYNLTDLIGVKGEFAGYIQGTSKSSGNLFTYMAGPQIKYHKSKFQPFGEALLGMANSNLYTNAGNASSTAFAMAFGGGLDYALTSKIQIRAAEVDYLYTKFGPNSGQNNFRYGAGVNFTF